MAIEKAEIFEILHLLTGELRDAMNDPDTPGKITKAEWLKIVQNVGIRAFQEAID